MLIINIKKVKFLVLFFFICSTATLFSQQAKVEIVKTFTLGSGRDEVSPKPTDQYVAWISDIKIDDDENIYLLDNAGGKIIVFYDSGEVRSIFFKDIVQDLDINFDSADNIELLGSRYLVLIYGGTVLIYDLINDTVQMMNDMRAKRMFAESAKFFMNYKNYIIITSPDKPREYNLISVGGFIGSFDELINSKRPVGMEIKKRNNDYYLDGVYFSFFTSDNGALIGIDFSGNSYRFGDEENGAKVVICDKNGMQFQKLYGDFNPKVVAGSGNIYGLNYHRIDERVEVYDTISIIRVSNTWDPNALMLAEEHKSQNSEE